ncbi:MULTISPECIES: hypothetical protein [unclassified Lysobacter]|uniref:hypothetical protein n=1 Tax=unclassified Lysobacter TaxID=2635362 RepID=UPI001BE67820|nr:MULTISPECIES: hypothetical protein [unclassified Lysobacter]MBT2747513.1 hypothetical protein [Lysobacter sp. ISL-42]MBT2752336.1 hypothetical protein [Lysobacter sp. ISL-50]MBT2776245.1 hypothetical protein [Lysobacter sp. ISL-54]MBT2784086.1 hypothetical protein [Lysobacter sp. ISL-52]
MTADSPADIPPFLLEGVLDALCVEDEPQRLLARIAQIPPDDTGTAASIARAAHDIERALVFAEDTQYFACLIDGQVVCGEFAGAGKLKPGHWVKAAVSRKGEALLAHAILDPQQGWLWMHHARGSAADAKAERRLALWLFCLCAPGMAAMIGLSSWLGGPWLRDPLTVQMWFLIGNAVVFGGMALSAGYRMDRRCESNNSVLGLLGFVDARRVDLTRYRIQQLATDKHLRFIRANKQALRAGQKPPIEAPALPSESACQNRDVHDYRQAIADGKAVVTR